MLLFKLICVFSIDVCGFYISMTEDFANYINGKIYFISYGCETVLDDCSGIVSQQIRLFANSGVIAPELVKIILGTVMM